MFNPPFVLNGYSIVAGQTYPKMQLSEKVPVTPEFRAEINAWMADFFGYACVVPEGQVFFLKLERTIICHPKDVQKLKDKLGKQFP
jgi:hypothetical protein